MKPLHPWQERVMDERAEVNERLVTLNRFLAKHEGDLDANDWALLEEQAAAMTLYRSTLDRRIARFE